MAAHSHRMPQQGPSRACEVLGFKRSRRHILCITLPTRFLWRRVLHIVRIAGGTRFVCEHTLGVGRHKSQLNRTSINLTLYRYGNLIKRQHIQWLTSENLFITPKLGSQDNVIMMASSVA